MFSQTSIERAIESSTLALIKNSPFDSNEKPLFTKDFKLVRHSIGQVAQANKHLASILGEDGTPTRPYTRDEIIWIRNERALCRCDFLYWATRYGFIIDWMGQLVRFSPNIAQQMAISVFSDLEEREVAILIQFLKARQLGITTLTELVILWKTIFHPRTISLIASSDPDKSLQMAKKIDLCFENQPYWLVPAITSYHQGEFIEFKHQRSYISIQHGTQLSGMARGNTPTAFHLSEVSDYSNPEALIDASLLHAVHDSPWVFGVLESTAAGRYNYWHNKWMFNVENWPLGRSRLCPTFLPWYVGTDIYPTPTWLKGHPIPKDWRPLDITISHANRSKAYVQSGQNALVTKFLGSTWEMPPEQMWYWEVTRAEAAAIKKLNDFYAEMPADANEAFQSSNISVFDAELISSFRENIKMPVGVYGIQAPHSEIPPQLQARETDIDTNSPPIEIRCKWAPNQPAHNYRLVPLLHRGSAPFDPLGKIIMWEPPKPGFIYGLGCDTGFGLGQDRSTIEILRKGDIQHNDAQVCEFASPYVNSFSLWPFNLALGTLYSTVVMGKLQQCKQVIEMAANGENVQNELKKRGWRNFHIWVRYDRKRIEEGKATRLGWYTLPWSRRMMMDMLLDALNNGWLDINSPWFIDEMADLELEYEAQKIKAVGGAHDDRVMGLGIVLFSLHAQETRNRDGWITRERMMGIAPGHTFASYSSGAQGTDISDARRDPVTSYAYQVIGGNDEGEDILGLRRAGATIWTPDMDEE
jgi:hypothetical protein